MSAFLTSLALVITITILFAIIGYIKYHDSYRQLCLRNARANYLIEEDHDEWIKNSNVQSLSDAVAVDDYQYRDSLEDLRKADKGKTNFCQVDIVDDDGTKLKSILNWDEDDEHKSETIRF